MFQSLFPKFLNAKTLSFGKAIQQKVFVKFAVPAGKQIFTLLKFARGIALIVICFEKTKL